MCWGLMESLDFDSHGVSLSIFGTHGAAFVLGLKWYGLQEWLKLPHQEKPAMKCLLKFSKWFLPQEETSSNVAIMVCPWYLLQDKTYTMGIIMLPMGCTYNTLQIILLMSVPTSEMQGAIHNKSKLSNDNRRVVHSSTHGTYVVPFGLPQNLK